MQPTADQEGAGEGLEGRRRHAPWRRGAPSSAQRHRQPPRGTPDTRHQAGSWQADSWRRPRSSVRPGILGSWSGTASCPWCYAAVRHAPRSGPRTRHPAPMAGSCRQASVRNTGTQLTHTTHDWADPHATMTRNEMRRDQPATRTCSWGLGALGCPSMLKRHIGAAAPWSLCDDPFWRRGDGPTTTEQARSYADAQAGEGPDPPSPESRRTTAVVA